eukprot:15018-Pelagococcus_subviridis.AAC.1
MRTRSSCRKHVWSCVTGRTFHLGLASFSFVGVAIPKIALESPTFATCSMSPIKCATTAVVPDNFASSPSSRTMTSFVRSNAVANAEGAASSPSSGDARLWSPRWFSKASSARSSFSVLGNVAAAICAASSPWT